MKNRSKSIGQVVFTLILVLFAGLMSTGASSAYADGESFSNHLLSSDGGVVATYNATIKELTISGSGTIEYDKWVAMAQKINPSYYDYSGSPKTASWGGQRMAESGSYDDMIDESNMKIIFSGGAKAIKLCGTEIFRNGLFAYYSGQVDFNGAVDLAPDAVDITYMFSHTAQFNEPIDFDTSNVINMRDMFSFAEAFDQPVDFDTSNVTNMSCMFFETKSFNQSLNFNTSNVTDMSHMFYCAESFNESLEFDTANVTSMRGMFWGTKVFNQPLDFNTSSVTDMSRMFIYSEAYNQPLNFDTSSVTNMDSMFSIAKAFNQPLNFDTRNVQSMDQMFYNAKAFNQPISFDISSLNSAEEMFKGSKIETVILKNSDDNQNIPAEDIFKNCTQLKHLEFSGLKDVAIAGFSDDYQISENDGTAIDKDAADSYSFNDNQKYFVCLQGDALDAISGCTIYAPELQVYNGKPMTPDADIEREQYPLVRNADYVLRYQDNVLPGTATIVINGIGRYYGEDMVTFKISSYPQMELSDDGNVVANYDDENSRLVISGRGQIDRQKWIRMSRQIGSDNFNFTYTGWEGEEPFDIYFENDETGKIKLPNNSQNLFKSFDQQVYFGDAVDTSDVSNMKAMFWKAANFNQPVNFNTANVNDMSYMFNNATAFKQPISFDVSSLTDALVAFRNSAVESVTFNNAAADQNIIATNAFKDCSDLKYLEFSGLKNASIEGFSGDYCVEENGGSLIAKSADEGYDFTDNQSYKVYLQSEAPLGVPTVSLSKAGSAIKVSWTAVPGATGYQVYRADKNGGPFTKFKTTSGLVYTNAGNLVPGMPYFYKVRAYKKDGADYTFGEFSDVKGY